MDQKQQLDLFTLGCAQLLKGILYLGLQSVRQWLTCGIEWGYLVTCHFQLLGSSGRT